MYTHIHIFVYVCVCEKEKEREWWGTVSISEKCPVTQYFCTMTTFGLLHYIYCTDGMSTCHNGPVVHKQYLM